MKEPIKYLEHVNSFTTREELYNIAKQIQIDAWNEALEEASVLVDERLKDESEIRAFLIDGSSILRLKK